VVGVDGYAVILSIPAAFAIPKYPPPQKVPTIPPIRFADLSWQFCKAPVPLLISSTNPAKCLSRTRGPAQLGAKRGHAITSERRRAVHVVHSPAPRWPSAKTPSEGGNPQGQKIFPKKARHSETLPDKARYAEIMAVYVGACNPPIRPIRLMLQKKTHVKYPYGADERRMIGSPNLVPQGAFVVALQWPYQTRVHGGSPQEPRKTYIGPKNPVQAVPSRSKPIPSGAVEGLFPTPCAWWPSARTQKNTQKISGTKRTQANPSGLKRTQPA
jgi:hypothetical protein